MDFNSKMEIADTVFTQEVDGELVVLDMNTEQYFALDDVASDIWKLLEKGKTLEETLNALHEMYDVERDQLCADLEVLVEKLLDNGLIHISGL